MHRRRISQGAKRQWAEKAIIHFQCRSGYVANLNHAANGRCTDNALADYRQANYPRQIIGQLSADYRLFISGCRSSFSKSRIVTIVKSQWYDHRLVTLLP